MTLLLILNTMITSETQNKSNNVCDLKYLTEMMGGKKQLIKEIMDVFLKQVPEELQLLNDAIIKADYPTIKNVSHTMKSSISIMSISSVTPVLKQMQELAAKSSDMEKIKELNQNLNSICSRAIAEIKKEMPNYI